MANIQSAFTFPLLSHSIYFLTFCLNQDLSKVYTLKLVAGSQIFLIGRFPIISSYCPLCKLVGNKTAHLSCSFTHSGFCIPVSSFHTFQCRLRVGPRGLVRSLLECDKDTAQVALGTPPGGTFAGIFLSLWS